VRGQKENRQRNQQASEINVGETHRVPPGTDARKLAEVRSVSTRHTVSTIEQCSIGADARDIHLASLQHCCDE
jgi:hypothetical protein